MRLSRAQNMFMPMNINSLFYYGIYMVLGRGFRLRGYSICLEGCVSKSVLNQKMVETIIGNIF